MHNPEKFLPSKNPSQLALTSVYEAAIRHKGEETCD